MPPLWLRYRDSWAAHSAIFSGGSLCLLSGFVTETACRPLGWQIELRSLCLLSGFVTETVPLRRAGRGAFASLCLLSGFVIEAP